MTQSTHEIVLKISKLKKEVPNDWAERIGKQLNKSPTLIRYYSRGERGVKKGYPLQVLKHLTAYHTLHQLEIKSFI